MADLPIAGEEYLPMTPKVGCVQHDCDGCKARGWRTMESAPKNRTILVYGRPTDVASLGISYFAAAAYTASWDAIDESFVLSGESWVGPFIEPTHWQERPAPPADLPGE